MFFPRSIIFVAFAAVLLASDFSTAEQDASITETCPSNEVYSTCVNPCNGCDIRGKCQFLVCNKGCDCQEGYYRDSDGTCIPASQCPNKPTIPPKCRKNERYYKCIPSCEQTCEAYANPGRLACKTLCRPGCFCKKGLYQRKDGKCVRPSRCKRPTTRPNVCGKHEEYTDCGTACEVTCSNRFSNAICTDQCVKGCFCKKGYIKNDNGKCVKPSQCPGETCGVGEEYTDCGSACPATCANIGDPPICTQQCVPGCFCQPGLVKNKEGRCVDKSECPTDNTCGVGEEYTDCGSACPATCANIVDPPICTQQCVPGCFCQPGLVKNNEERCVDKSECPTGNTCPENEEYSTCANPCNDCETKGKCQFLVCNKGCDCKQGHYRDINGKCIPECQCPDTEKPVE